eukprot:544224-Hanusia_phi.AAC.1
MHKRLSSVAVGEAEDRALPGLDPAELKAAFDPRRSEEGCTSSLEVLREVNHKRQTRPAVPRLVVH